MGKCVRCLIFCLPLWVAVSSRGDESRGSINGPTHLELAVLQNSLNLSPDVAHVTDASQLKPGGLPEFILIQDIHNHPEAQGHIASVILQAYHYWGTKKVFMEGAVSNVDLTMFHRVPAKTRTMLLERLVKDGDLSGPELATVLLMEREWSNPPVSPFQLLGMENAKLYRQNLTAYLQVQQSREVALYEINKIRRLQTSLNIQDTNILAQQLNRTEALIRMKLTPTDYEAYLASKAAIPSSPALDPMIRQAENFYKFVILRSHAFLVEAEKKLPAGTGPRVLVVGGFHTPFMATELRKLGKSFVVITPRVTQSGYEPLYERHMLESVSTLQLSRSVRHPDSK